MNRIFGLMFLCLFFVACNKDGGGSASDCQAQDNGATDCTVTSEPVTGDTDPKPPVVITTGGTTGSPAGITTGGTTGSTTGGTTGGTTGSTTGGSSTGTSTGGSTTGGTTGSLTTAAYTFDTNIDFLNATSTEQAKFDKAIDMIKRVVATEEFRNAVINHTYNGKKTFVDNGGFTNTQIYQKILDGAEKLQPSKNNTMDMEVEMYYTNNSTVGYTYPNVKKIWVNRKFFTSNTVGKVGANLFHEWLHKVGFTHATSYSTSRDYSVPYAVGRMISNIGSNL